MVGRSMRQKPSDTFKDLNTASHPKTFLHEPSAPVTYEDRMRWNGFCEIESEPAYFNAMLKKFGVKGVKVHEVVSLDDEILGSLPRPVYGLIFLFKWVEEDPDRQEQSCPEGVWFANQVNLLLSRIWECALSNNVKTINNACASVAMLNIVNNIPDIELGENLCAFKDFTTSFSPALRGDAIGNFDFVKRIHNSFARKMDMLNGDLLLSNEAMTKAKSKKQEIKHDENAEETGFHFIAFMPIEDQLWKLDGLERQPMCLGAYESDWLSQVKPDIEARMAQYEEGQIEFAVLSLVRDPLLSLVPSLVENIKSVVKLSARLDLISPDWRKLAGSDATVLLTESDLAYGVTVENLEQALIPSAISKLCDSDVIEDIVAQWQLLVTEQAQLRLRIKDEHESNQSDEDRAAARGCDYGAMMQHYVRKVKAKRRLLNRTATV